MGLNIFANIAKKREIVAELEKQSQETMQELQNFFNENLQNYKKKVQAEISQMHNLDTQKISDFNKMLDNYNQNVQKLVSNRMENFDKVLASYNEQIEALSEEIKTLQENKVNIINKTQEDSHKVRNDVLAQTEARIKEEYDNLHTQQNELAKLQTEYEEAKQAFDLEQQKFKADRKLLEDYAEKLNQERADIDKIVFDKISIEKQNLRDYEQQLRSKEADIKATVEKETEFERERLNDFKSNIEDRESRLEQIIEEKTQERVEDRKKEMEAALSRAKADIKYFSEKAQGYEKLEQQYQEMYDAVGKDPASVMKQLAEKNEIIRQLREDLINRPTKEMEEEYNNLNKKKAKINEIYEKINERKEEYELAFQENADLKTQIEPLNSQIDALEKELARYRDIHQAEANRDERIEAIEVPLDNFSNKTLDTDKKHVKEMEWINEIDTGIKNFGLVFPKRILYAFHTALKCGEISPLTVLAGVSGTGKSELPRLYSHFGGLNFLSLPVQPNWDSQESMLGYFNSIDNRFDTQDVLRLLVQTQKDEALKEAMTLILLDEMNLANVELYFSDFLSKLETRRGLSDDSLPSIAVKLGSGLDDYQIPLGRNVLWTGTMNQDETTKTLSDKVLDRGIVINFPSPNNLESRKTTNVLPKSRALLRRSVWNSWINKSTPETIKKDMDFYKNIIEGINNDIGKAGRAIGHRVWQSIESYIINYPSVIYYLHTDDTTSLKKEMNKAFADQLVQKIMPKLRGLEVEGVQGDCLNAVKSKISNYGLDEDFKNAMELGYGQFMWNTSNYALDSNNTDLSDSSEQSVKEERKK